MWTMLSKLKIGILKMLSILLSVGIIKFSILGERCSGTNFLERSMKENFVLESSDKYTHKHFFGFNTFEDSDDTLFIGIVRDPHRWANSFFKRQWHLPRKFRNKHVFLNQKFHSGSYMGIYPWKKHKYTFPEIRSVIGKGPALHVDTHIHTHEIYKDIFELRKVKLEFLIKEMPTKVKHYIFIRYEDLNSNFERTMNMIRDNFNLKTSNKYPYKETKYKMRNDADFKENLDFKISPDEIYKSPRLDIKTENLAGYNIPH